MTSDRDDWVCGYAAALAAIMRRPDHDDVLVKQTLIGDGITADMLREAGVEAYDLNPLLHALGEG